MYKVLINGTLFCDSRIDDLAIVNPVVRLKENSAGSFTFSIPPTHPRIDLIKPRTAIFSVYRDDDLIFEGCCISESIDFFKNKSVSCEGALSYLNDSIQRQAKYENVGIRQYMESIINSHNQQVEDFKKLEVGQVTVQGSVNYITNMVSTMQALKNGLATTNAGHMRIRKFNGKNYIDYLAESPRTSTQKIELGKNLIDYKSNIDSTNISTVVIPLGARLESQTIEGVDNYVDIKSVNGGKDYLESSAIATMGSINKVVFFDDVSAPSVLKEKGLLYLQDSQFESVYLEIKAIDLGLLSKNIQHFELLDSIRAVSPTHGMDKYFMLTEMTLNLSNPDNDVFVLGKNEQISLSAQSAQAFQKSETSVSLDEMQSAINNATTLLSGGVGGHIVIRKDVFGHPYEILVMDTDDINTAQRVWRWNQNGFGYSSHGYLGPYETAITMNGSIVASFLQAGVVRGLQLEGSSLKLSGTKTFYAANYDDDDYDWIVYYIRGTIIPNSGDYLRFDFDMDGEITDRDRQILDNMIKTQQDYVCNFELLIDASSGDPFVKIGGTRITASQIKSYAAKFSQVDTDYLKVKKVQMLTSETSGVYVDGASYDFAVKDVNNATLYIGVHNGIVTSVHR